MKTLLLKIALLAFIISFASNALAQNVEQLVCKDRSVYEGFIVEQKASKSMTVFAEKATVVIKKSLITSPVTTSHRIENLSEDWQHWVRENLSPETSEITLKSFSSNGITYNNVYVIEDGSYVTFLDLTKRNYTIPWANVQSTTKTLRSENEFSGVNDVVVTKGGERFVGQITEQCLGQYLKIRTEDDRIVSISPTDLLSTSVEPINDNLPLFKQVRLLDIIEVDGQKIEGVIVSREFGKILCLQFKDGRVREYPIGKVTTYGKRLNPDFVSLKDRIMTVGEIYLDGEKPQMTDRLVRDVGFVIPDTTYITKKKGSKVMLEVNTGCPHHFISVAKTVSINVFKLNEEGKQDRSLGRETIVVAKYEDLLLAPLESKRYLSPLGNVNVEYTFAEEGVYVIYIEGMDKVLVIKVEK